MTELRSVARNEMPIFVVGSHRSGSTLLRLMLDSHEHIACPPESKFIAGLNEFIHYPQVLLALGSMGFNRSALYSRLGEFVNSIHMDYATRSGKRRWADKTPNYYRLVNFIDELFCRNVLFLVMVRHPLDTIASLREILFPWFYNSDPDLTAWVNRYGDDKYSFARLWTEVYGRLYVNMQADSGRFHVVRYEDIVRWPDSTLQETMAFLDESCSSALVDRVFNIKHDAGFQDPKITKTAVVHGESVNRWRTWPDGEVAALWEMVEAVAKCFGYSSPSKQNAGSVEEIDR
jgi:hypothetical protein